MEQIEFRGNWHRNLSELTAWVRGYEEAPLEPALPIVDSHHHLLDDRERGHYLLRELTEDIATGHNIIATVCVESGSMYRVDGPPAFRSVGEVEFANGAAVMSASGLYGNVLACAAIVGMADLALGTEVQPVLEALLAAGNGRFRGIRHSTPWDSGVVTRFYRRQIPRHQLLDPTFRAGFARLEPLGLSFDAWMFYRQLPELADLLRAFPETKVILNHVGGILGIDARDSNRDEVFQIWCAHLRELAQYPNLSVKVGGLGLLYGGWDFHLRDVPPSSEELSVAWRPYVEACVEAFGVKRCMVESNFPVDKQSCGYGVLFNAMKRITRNWSATEKAALYRDTAWNTYRLGESAATRS